MRAPHVSWISLAALVVVGCRQDAAPSKPAPDTVPSTAATASTAASAATATPPTTATPPASAATPPASAAPAAAIDGGARAVAKAAEATPHPAATKVTGNHFTLDVATPGCIAGTECAVTLRLEATGGYHINQEYPYKVTMDATPSVAFLSKDGTGAFSKAANDFRIDSEHVATMTVKIKPAAKGPAALSGLYKMSVCSEANCQIEQTRIALVVPVM
jgi:hypothetical protein